MSDKLSMLSLQALFAGALLVMSACGDPDTANLPPSTQAPCQVDCDCAQGQLCSAGQCKDGAGALFCCEKAGCEPGARCVDRRGIVSTCLECVVDCDCPQGQACDAGQCQRTNTPVYCCDKDQCPVNQACTDLEGAPDVCPPECIVDCDCPQGQACSSSGLCLETSPPTYCCNGESCPQGQACSKPDGTSGLCAAPMTADPVCGNGVIEAGERCDGNCPGSCDDQNACTRDTILGANTCQAECRHAPINACDSGDGCCPAGCDFSTDQDCPNPQRCGDGVLDPGERCDGNCPSSCDDQDACTSDSLTGSASQCTAQCVSSPITSCRGGDGCCPSGCTFSTDSDCAPPMPTGQIGSACTQDGQCQGLRAGCITQASSPIYRDGYCTKTCAQDAECGAGSHCSATQAQCVKTCRQSSDCRTGYVCADDDGDLVSECVPAQGAPGDACNADNACRGDGAVCWLAADGLFKDGYCSRPCTNNRACGGQGSCVADNNGGNKVCLGACNSDSDCRGTGYVCQDKNGDGVKECLATNNGSGQLGDACAGIWACGSTTPECLTSEPAIGQFPGGYCTDSCDLSAANSCPTGSQCVGGVRLPIPIPFGTGYCVETCTRSSQCRAGYSCRDYDDGFNPIIKICVGT